LKRYPGVKEVLLLHVVDTAHLLKKGFVQDLYIQDARIHLNEQKKHLENIGLKVKVKIEVITGGDVSHAIIEILNKEKTTLVVMGAHGKSLIEGILLGSVATDVLRYGNSHVLIMRHKFGERHGDKKYKGETQEEIDTCIKEAKKRLEDIAKDFRSEGIKVKIHALAGSPSESIISLAEEENASGSIILSPGLPALCAPEEPDLAFISRTKLTQPPVSSIVTAVLTLCPCRGHPHLPPFQHG
jgi:nucleotide-binding universal stress UspA family protein